MLPRKPTSEKFFLSPVSYCTRPVDLVTAFSGSKQACWTKSAITSHSSQKSCEALKKNSKKSTYILSLAFSQLPQKWLCVLSKRGMPSSWLRTIRLNHCSPTFRLDTTRPAKDLARSYPSQWHEQAPMDEPDIFTMESHEIWPGPRSQTSLADSLGHSQMSSKQILGGAGQVLALLPWTNSSVT